MGLSATGYAAEISTLFLNVRKFQHAWMRKHSFWYSLNSGLLLLTYPTTRVGGAAAILAGSLWPHWAEYKSKGLGSLVVFTSVTYIALALMSTFFTYTLVKKGIKRALVFKPVEGKEQ